MAGRISLEVCGQELANVKHVRTVHKSRLPGPYLTCFCRSHQLEERKRRKNPTSLRALDIRPPRIHGTDQEDGERFALLSSDNSSTDHGRPRGATHKLLLSDPTPGANLTDC